MSFPVLSGLVPVAALFETNNGRLDHPTLTLFGQRGDLGWMLATGFGILVMVVIAVVLGAVARKYRPQKPETARPGVTAQPAKPATPPQA